MTATLQAYLNEERKYLGYHETGDNITPFGAFTGFNGLAWCGSFQEYCAHAVGLDLPGKGYTGMVSTHIGYAAYKAAGRLIAHPAVGAHIFYDWSGNHDPANIHHIGLIEAILPDGSLYVLEGNVNDSVMRVHRTTTLFTVGYGMPVYASAPPPPPVVAKPVPKPTTSVSLAALIRAERIDGPAAQGHQTYPAGVRLVESALKAEHLLAPAYAGDGSFGTSTRIAYQEWQRKCGYTGKDADGVPGTASLTRLGARHGFHVTA